MNYKTKVRLCAEHLVKCLSHGSKKSDLDKLEKLWWDYEGWRHTKEYKAVHSATNRNKEGDETMNPRKPRAGPTKEEINRVDLRHACRYLKEAAEAVEKRALKIYNGLPVGYPNMAAAIRQVREDLDKIEALLARLSSPRAAPGATIEDENEQADAEETA